MLVTRNPLGGRENSRMSASGSALSAVKTRKRRYIRLPSPVGTIDRVSSRAYGTPVVVHLPPTVETVGYFQIVPLGR